MKRGKISTIESFFWLHSITVKPFDINGMIWNVIQYFKHPRFLELSDININNAPMASQ